ncbi:hypothetical protein CDFC105_104129 [Clostridioides difficile]|nr:hypothetical protein CDFC105_104129 [Clostridioides difficile]
MWTVGGGGFCFLMIRRPPRSTQSRSSAASDVYKRQGLEALLLAKDKDTNEIIDTKKITLRG